MLKAVTLSRHGLLLDLHEQPSLPFVLQGQGRGRKPGLSLHLPKDTNLYQGQGRHDTFRISATFMK